MQTFLPYPDFAASAAVIDQQRLGKQRLEVSQILNVLTGHSTSWGQHPAVHMWTGHAEALALYGRTVCLEWISRGYNDTMLDRFPAPTGTPTMPAWLGDPAFHASHRSNLLRKNPAWYGQFGWTEPDTMPYVWPNDPQHAVRSQPCGFCGALAGFSCTPGGFHAARRRAALTLAA